MALRFDLAAVGDNCIDRYLPPVGFSTVGGNAVNVGVHLARIGHQVAYFGAIGEDESGRRVQTALTQNGLAVARLRIVPNGQTAFTEIATRADGEREIRFEEFGACRGYRPTETDVAHLKRKRHVHIGWLDDGGALKQELVRAGVSVSQDLTVNTDPSHASADGLSIAFSSAGASAEKADALLRHALSAGARLAVVTCGPLGSCASDGRGTVAVPAVSASIVDTTGAGDSFIAGFLGTHLSGADLEKSLRAGAELAAATCSHLGGFPQRVVPVT